MSTPLALIIEDDPDLSTIFDHALQSAGFATEVLLDGKVAQERLKTAQPAVIILDMHLPRVSGVELLAQIHEDNRIKRVPVVVTTADARLGESLADSVDFVLIKPISFVQLRELSQRLKPKE